MNKFSKKEMKALGLDDVVAEKKNKKPINFNLYLALSALFLGVVGLCTFIKMQEFSVTITFPPLVVAFVVAVLGLSALYVIFQEVRK